MSNTVQPLAAPDLKILCHPFAVATKGLPCPTILINAQRNFTNRRRTRIALPRCTTEKKTTRPARSIQDKPWSIPPRRTRRLWMRINGRKTRRRNRASSNLYAGEPPRAGRCATLHILRPADVTGSQHAKLQRIARVRARSLESRNGQVTGRGIGARSDAP